jgi:hypothetical protein
MKTKTTKDKYTITKYEDLHFAVSQHGTAMHKNLWDLMVDAGLNKRQIFTKYMKMLRNTSQVNHAILKTVGVRHFSFEGDNH